MCNVHCVVGDAVCSHEQVMKGVVRQGTKTRCGTHDGATQEELGRGGGGGTKDGSMDGKM